MIERRTSELHVARQLFKHDNIIHFRIYASVRRLPKVLNSVDSIYELQVGTWFPFSCWINRLYVRNFQRWEIAFEILTERVNTVSRQFGFERVYLKQWEAEQCLEEARGLLDIYFRDQGPALDKWQAFKAKFDEAKRLYHKSDFFRVKAEHHIRKQIIQETER